MSEEISVSVFSAASSGTARASAIFDVPVAMVAIAMDVDTALAALNLVRYGAGHLRSDEPDGRDWTDWRLLEIAAPGWIMSCEVPVPVRGTIRVPIDDVEIDAFAKRLTHRLRPLRLLVPAGSFRTLHQRNGGDGAAMTRSRSSALRLRSWPVDDLYVFDPQAQGEWLYDMAAAALEDARSVAAGTPRRNRPDEEGSRRRPSLRR